MKRPRKPEASALLKHVMQQRRLPLQPMLDLPLQPQEPEEPRFLRSKTRTRVRRARRGPLGRAILVAQAAALLLLAALAGWAGYARVMASERLKVGRLEIRGSHFLAEQEVHDLLGSAVGDNILGLDIDALKSRLRASPWVADAAIARALPDTLRVEIRERAPLALAEADQLQLMDEDGTLIEPYGPRTSAFDLPIVRGLKGVAPAMVRERAQRAGALLRDLGDLQAEVSEVDVQDEADLKVVLRGAGEVLRMGVPPYRQKLQTYLELRSDLARRCPAAEYFDLRFKNRIFVFTPPPPRPVSVAAEQASPKDAVVPKDRSPQDRSLPEPALVEPSPSPVLDPSVEPDAQGDATEQPPTELSEVGPG